MPLTKIKSLGITDGTILGTDVNSTFDLTGKTVTLPAGTGGKVLQVVQASDGSSRSTTSTSFVTASNTLSVSVTPSSTSNKVLIFVNISYTYIGSYRGEFTVYRGATNLAPVRDFFANHSGSVEMPGSFCYLDSPSSTSATTYQVYFRVSGGTGYMGAANSLSTITALEIAG